MSVVKTRGESPASAPLELEVNLGLLEQLASTNRSFLALEVVQNLAQVQKNLGTGRFKQLVRQCYPMCAKELLQKLSMAQLKMDLEAAGLLTTERMDALMRLGISGCAVLAKASAELAVELLEKAIANVGVTLTHLKALVRRAEQGASLLPTAQEITALQPTELVQIIKRGKTQHWVAEIVTSPDELGRITVKLVKTNRVRQLFFWEVAPLELETPDLDSVVSAADWQAIATQLTVLDATERYRLLSSNDLDNLKEVAWTVAQQQAAPEETQIEVRWKHLCAALVKYNLVPVEASIGQPAEGTSAITESVIAEITNTRQLINTLNEELSVCVQDATKDILRQQLRYAEKRLESALNGLCDVGRDRSPQTAIPECSEGTVELVNQINAQQQRIEQLETEQTDRANATLELVNQINAQQQRIEELENQPKESAATSTSPGAMEWNALPIKKIEELAAGDVIRVISRCGKAKVGDMVKEVLAPGKIKTHWFGVVDNRVLGGEHGWKIEKLIPQHLEVTDVSLELEAETAKMAQRIEELEAVLEERLQEICEFRRNRITLQEIHELELEWQAKFGISKIRQLELQRSLRNAPRVAVEVIQVLGNLMAPLVLTNPV